MGIKQRKKKIINPSVAIADTGVRINGCSVLMGSPNPVHAQRVANSFKPFLNEVMGRARVPNIQDLYATQFNMLERIKSGETIEDIIS